MIELVFLQMTQKEPQSCHKFNCFRIMAVKDTISKWSVKFKDAVSKNIETARVPYIQIKIISLYNG